MQASFERISTQPERSVSFGPRNTSVSPSSCSETNIAKRSRDIPIFQQGGSTRNHLGPTVLEYSSADSGYGSVRKMDYSYVQPSPYGMRATPDNKPLYAEPVSDGRMDRSSIGSAERMRPIGSQYGQLAGHSTGNAVLSDAPDTDLCLSMVNETRPSYQMKTYGKTPLTPPHLMSLVDSSDYSKNVAAASHSPKVSPYSVTTSSALHSSSSYSASTIATNLPPPPPPSKPIGSYSKPSVSPNSSRTPYNSISSGDYNRPSNIYTEFDPDEYLKDVKFVNQKTTTAATTLTSSSSPAGRYPFVSPNAKGLAPPPTDQPIRNPAKVGIEADVDALTIRMMRNMESGEGAAGEYNCIKCSEGISVSRPGCTALNHTYHLKCFTCTVCNVELAGGSFYSVDGKPFCEKDYQDTLDKCTACNKPILDRILKASGKPYHPHCFICTSCARSLDGVPFTVDSNNMVHCVECFHDKFAPRCAICHKPIIPEPGKQESMRVVAMDKSFHLHCYKCEDCGMELSSKVEGKECYPLDDHLLCKKCNAARIRSLTTA